jgi:hypothetical protein
MPQVMHSLYPSHLCYEVLLVEEHDSDRSSSKYVQYYCTKKRYDSCPLIHLRHLQRRQIIYLFFTLGETFSFHIPRQKPQLMQMLYTLLMKKRPFFACFQISLSSCTKLNTGVL